MRSSMQDGVALVTNADTDIGIAVANRLIDAGCTKLMLAGKSDAALEAARKAVSSRQIGGNVRLETFVYQTETYGDVEKAITQTVKSLGVLDYAVNCLSMLPVPRRSTAETEAKDYKEGLAGSSREIWLLNKAQTTYFLSHQQNNDVPGPAIVNIIPFGNIGVNYSAPIQTASSYSATGITKSLARDVRPHGIRINAVCPSATDSKEDRAVAAASDEKAERLIRVEEVANAAVFLVGPEASGITGVALPVDGGWCLTHN